MKIREDYLSALISRRYGRKMGLVRHWGHLGQLLIGSYSELKMIEWSRVNRLVFVCKGNICRSPYAEARARSMGLPCASFGLEAEAGTLANPAAMRGATARGLDLTSHRTRSASEFQIAKGDLLTAMEPSQVASLMSRPMPAGAQVTLLGLWSTPIRPHIEDPFGLSDDYFQTCFEVIDNALATISDLVKKPETNPQPR
jgi:protein-tyrosine phosphatase